MNKTVGSIFVASGTAIGAGMLALPLVSAGMGFTTAAFLFIGIWAIMLISGLLTLEVNLAFEAPRNSYATMAEATLGKAGKWFTYMAFILLLYALTSAYITGGASLLQAAETLVFGKALSSLVNAVLFTLVVGGVVAWGTRPVDLLNRGLFSVKVLSLIAVFSLFLPQIDVTALFAQQAPRYLFSAAPVVLTAFGFHIVIPSLAAYIGRDAKRLAFIVVCGSMIPLIIYLLWLASLLGTIPYQGPFSFSALAQEQGSVGELMLAVNHWQHTAWLSLALNAFAHIAVITSFLGVSLSLFDFLRDKEHEVVPHRARTAVLTFTPPLLIALVYPDGFVQLLSYASIFVAVILIMLPAAMAYRLRKMPELASNFRVKGGTPLLAGVMLAGVLFIIVEVMRFTDQLPLWAG